MKTMTTSRAVLLGLVFALGAFAVCGQEFVAPDPQELIASDAGSLKVWGENFQELQKAGLNAVLIEVAPGAIQVPLYMDTHALAYVLQGSARIGLVTPLGTATRHRELHAGQVWAIPKGWVHWIWNEENEKKEPFRFLGVSDTRNAGLWGKTSTFHLTGANQQDFGSSILHGFSSKVLAQAWDVKEEEVQTLLQSQDASHFVKVEDSEPSRIRALREVEGKHHDKDDRKHKDADWWWKYLVFDLNRARPEIKVKHGGEATVVNEFKLKGLKLIKLALIHVRLESGAQLAPNYANFNRAVYVTKGSGHVEVVYNNGEPAVQNDVKEGDFFVIPANFPASWIAANSGLETIIVAETGSGLPTFLAGANSVFTAIPQRVLQHSFGADSELLEKLESTRRHDIGIFPPNQNQPMKGAYDAAWMEEAKETATNFADEAKEYLHKLFD